MNETQIKKTIVFPLRCVMATGGVLRINNIASGIGIIIYSAAHKIAAGAHVMMSSSLAQEGANPGGCANTVIPHILDRFKERGVGPPFSIALAGGATMLHTSKGDIGKKLVATIKGALSQAGLQVKLEKTGGRQIRSMTLYIDEGKIGIADAKD